MTRTSDAVNKLNRTGPTTDPRETPNAKYLGDLREPVMLIIWYNQDDTK